jgi:hypothetical protein
MCSGFNAVPSKYDETNFNNYDNDTNPLAKTGYDDVGSFAAPIVSLELLLETIPKVDAKPEAKKNNTTIGINLNVIIRNKVSLY